MVPWLHCSLLRGYSSLADRVTTILYSLEPTLNTFNCCTISMQLCDIHVTWLRALELIHAAQLMHIMILF